MRKTNLKRTFLQTFQRLEDPSWLMHPLWVRCKSKWPYSGDDGLMWHSLAVHQALEDWHHLWKCVPLNGVDADVVEIAGSHAYYVLHSFYVENPHIKKRLVLELWAPASEEIRSIFYYR